MVGINLGKNKTSDNAITDYVSGVVKFAPIADYLVINVSSPNTPGLRDLQNQDDLKLLLTNILQARNTLAKENDHPVPIVLKLAPDLTDKELRDIAAVIKRKECQVDGLIISNTTIARSDLLKSPTADEVGGLSGAPLTERSTEMIRQMYKLTQGRIPIIGVGGVFSGIDAYNKILAGASVVQIYTSFAYHGPPIVSKIKRELDALLRENGYKNVTEAVGRGVQ